MVRWSGVAVVSGPVVLFLALLLLDPVSKWIMFWQVMRVDVCPT